MKLKIYKSLDLKENIDDDIAQIRAYFLSDFVKSIVPGGIDITLDVETTSVSKKDALSKLMLPLKGKYDVVMYCYERPAGSGGFLGTTHILDKGLMGIFQEVDPVDDAQNYIWKCMCHELLHAITNLKAQEKGITIENLLDNPKKDGKVDMSLYVAGNQNPYMVGGNFYQQLKATFMSYKYFKESEVVGLKPDFVQLLDKIRGECGFPFVITSGFRTQAQNASLSDAVSDSAHLSGLAVDIAIKDSFKRFKAVSVALSNGITRIGVGNGFIHIDVSKTLPQNVIWCYY